MSRHARYTLPDIPQYVVQRGHNGEPIFIEENDYIYYRDYLIDTSIQYGCEIHAYVFLKNQVHLLITQQTPNGIAQLFQSLGRRYVRYFNDLHGRSGTLWEGRYKSCLVESECYLMACHRFIDLLPVREGLVKQAEDYRWSSAYAYILGTHDPLITVHPAYYQFIDQSEKQQQKYINFLKQGVSKNEEKLIKESVNKSGVLGNEPFKFEVERILGWRVRPRKPGRPKRIDSEST